VRRRRPLTGVLIAIPLLMPLAGCGYKAGGPYRADIKTVYVEMFGSREFRRDLEFQLTEAVKKRIGSDTPYRLAAREKADTILSGELIEERQSAWAPDYLSRQPREKQLSLAMKLQWRDVRTGRMLVDVPVQLSTVDYLPPARESEKFAQERAVDGMARQIVAKMYEDW
jgi:hypothetical protein